MLVKGVAASSGMVEGVAQVMLPREDMSKFIEGNILVTTLTDPTMVQIMIRAGAIITDLGGITSHPAILSREMGIPCVVGAKNATTQIKNGSRIRVDGALGAVYELD